MKSYEKVFVFIRKYILTLNDKITQKQIIVLLAIWNIVLSVVLFEHSDQIDQIDDDIEELQDDIEELGDKIEELGDKIEELDERVSEQEEEQSSIKDMIDRIWILSL
ncbi:hypothetical protein Barb6XT_00990 [Bacteroidales bacterium Barb6XT]|nr:hypothetical protein Barb6XT_00990 [Bacteroidales bacterium Barb6XT]